MAGDGQDAVEVSLGKMKVHDAEAVQHVGHLKHGAGSLSVRRLSVFQCLIKSMDGIFEIVILVFKVTHGAKAFDH